MSRAYKNNFHGALLSRGKFFNDLGTPLLPDSETRYGVGG
jgi:hypothetical protein